MPRVKRAPSQQLLAAAAKGQATRVGALLAAGAGPDVVGGRGHGYDTPLKAACRRGHLSVVSLLLAAGADPEHTCAGNRLRALYLAVDNGHLPIAKALLRAGCDVNAPNDFRSETALMAAVRRGHRAMERLLVRHGADGMGIAEYRLYLAAVAGDLRATRRLLKQGVDASRPAPNGTSATLAACQAKDARILMTLIAGGAHPTSQALEVAALSGNVTTLRILLGEPIASAGSKNRDRNNLALVRDRAKREGWDDVPALLTQVSVQLGLRKRS